MGKAVIYIVWVQGRTQYMWLMLAVQSFILPYSNSTIYFVDMLIMFANR